MSASIHVLFIEDNPGDARLIMEELRLATSRTLLQLEWVDRLEKGLQSIESKDVQAILLDLNLPDSQGLDTLQRVLSCAPHIAVIVMTGYADEETGIRAMQAGAQDYLIKGEVDGRLLIHSIKYAIQRKRTEEALRESEERSRLVVESVPNSIVMADANGKILLANVQTERLFGYSRDELIGQSIELLVPERYRIRHLNYRTLFMHHPSAKPMGAGRDLFGLRKDGSEFPVEIGLNPIQTEQGTMVLASIVDLTERRRTEESLARTIDLLSRAEQIGKIGSWAWDISEDQVEWSDGLYRIFGLTPREFGATYEAYLERVHPDDRDTVRQIIETAYRERGSFEFENRIVRPDGEIRIEYSRGEVIINDRGEPARLQGIGMDITDRKQAEELLRQSQERAESILAGVNDIYILLDRDWHYLYANEAAITAIAAANPVGVAKEQILGRTLWELFPDILGTELESQYRAAMDQHLATRSEFHYLTRDTWWENRFYPIAGGLAVFGTDISERKKAEDRVQHQMQQLSALRKIDIAISSGFELQADLDVILDQTVLQLGVDACAVLLLEPESQMLKFAASRGFHSTSHHSTELKPGEGYAGQSVQARKTVHISDLMDAGSKLVTSLHMENEAFVEYYGVPLIVKGEVKGVLEIYHRSCLEADAEWLEFMEALAGQAALAIDNAQLFAGLQQANTELERRVAERTAELNNTNAELEHASRAKDEFLANMSHELRTPLNSILGLSETLLEERRGTLNEHQRRSLRIIESSGHHLLDMINDILDLSKIEAGKLDYYPQAIDVDELCRSSLAFIRALAAKKAITINYINRSKVLHINADARRLKQVLINLLTNAVKFTPERGVVTLQVSTELEQELIQFMVSDTGIGIAKEDLKKLFQPFSQIDSSMNRQYEGTGLGLALVQKLVDLHGGSVQVESDGVPGRGSRFTVNLSCKQDHSADGDNLDLAQAAPTSVENTSPTANVPAHQDLILLAEDNMANILTIGEYLKSYGYGVIVAHDGLEALAMAEEVKPDLILMDIQMPAMDGLEAITRLRAELQFAATPIIALTALAMPGDRERCLQAGASEYMSKPVSLKSLRQTIQSLL